MYNTRLAGEVALTNAVEQRQARGWGFESPHTILPLPIPFPLLPLFPLTPLGLHVGLVLGILLCQAPPDLTQMVLKLKLAVRNPNRVLRNGARSYAPICYRGGRHVWRR